MPKITPFLWFDNQAEEAMNYYVSVFPGSEVLSVARYGDGAPLPSGALMTATLRLAGQELMVLNGGPHVSFNEAVSLLVRCQTQEEVDYYWEKLTAGGEGGRCGWLKDRYGLSWQVVPDALGEMLQDPDPARARRALTAMLQMSKLDLAALSRARDGQ